MDDFLALRPRSPPRGVQGLLHERTRPKFYGESLLLGKADDMPPFGFQSRTGEEGAWTLQQDLKFRKEFVLFGK